MALVLCLLASVAADRLMSPDEGIWFWVARVWVDDHVPPYQGPMENKTPGIFYVFSLSYLAAGAGRLLPRAAGIVALTSTSIALHAIGRRIAGRDAGLAAMLIGGLVFASRAVDPSDTSCSESFMIACTAVGIARVVSGSALADRSRRRAMLQAGAALGAGIAFKQVAVFTAPVFLAFAWTLTPREQRSVAGVARDVSWMIAGAGAATLASLLPLWLAGVSFREYLEGAWLLLRDRGSGGQPPLQRTSVHRPWNVYPMPLLMALAGLFLLLRWPIRRRGVPWGPVVIWILLDAAGATASGNNFPHQYKQVVPSVAMAGGVLVAMAIAAIERFGMAHVRARLGVLVLAALVFLPYHTVENRVRPHRDRQRHYQYAVARWIREHTGPDDRIHTQVGGGLIQTLSERRSSARRYFNRNFITTDTARAEVLGDFAARPPRVIVFERRVVPFLAPYTAACCDLKLREGNYLVYARRPPPG